METYNLWIEKGYEHFGLYGPDHLSIKRIAEELYIARTSFNYHFKDKDEFIDELIRHHYDLHKQFCETGKRHCKKYLPDIHQLVLVFPEGFKFHKQLFNHKQIDKYSKVFNTCNEISANEFVIQLFINYYSLPLTFKDASELHESLLETWYSRLDTNDMTLEKLVRSTEEIMSALLALMQNSRNNVSLPLIPIPSKLDLTSLSKN